MYIVKIWALVDSLSISSRLSDRLCLQMIILKLTVKVLIPLSSGRGSAKTVSSSMYDWLDLLTKLLVVVYQNFSDLLSLMRALRLLFSVLEQLIRAYLQRLPQFFRHRLILLLLTINDLWCHELSSPAYIVPPSNRSMQGSTFYLRLFLSLSNSPLLVANLLGIICRLNHQATVIYLRANPWYLRLPSKIFFSLNLRALTFFGFRISNYINVSFAVNRLHWHLSVVALVRWSIVDFLKLVYIPWLRFVVPYLFWFFSLRCCYQSWFYDILFDNFRFLCVPSLKREIHRIRWWDCIRVIDSGCKLDLILLGL